MITVPGDSLMTSLYQSKGTRPLSLPPACALPGLHHRPLHSNRRSIRAKGGLEGHRSSVGHVDPVAPLWMSYDQSHMPARPFVRAGKGPETVASADGGWVLPDWHWDNLRCVPTPIPGAPPKRALDSFRTKPVHVKGSGTPTAVALYRRVTAGLSLRGTDFKSAVWAPSARPTNTRRPAGSCHHGTQGNV